MELVVTSLENTEGRRGAVTVVLELVRLIVCTRCCCRSQQYCNWVRGFRVGDASCVFSGTNDQA